ncbi:MAG: ribose-phosphate pyrophosphokinase [Rhodospirillaceae bacterium]|nr:ribose-phosphate pyrophosphokinase [Rhodospirillaceae bacterium]
MTTTAPRIAALNAGRDFAARIAAILGVKPLAHEERDFEDGEHKIRPLESVRGSDVYLVQSLHGGDGMSVNDKLARLLFFIGGLKDAGAVRVTAVVPYLCYARKDRRTKPRDPVTTRYVAALFEAVGTDRIVTVDVHNRAAYDNAFRMPAEHLEARKLFVDHVRATAGDAGLVVVSPDEGGVKRAERFRQGLAAATGCAVGSGFVEKYRSEGVVSGGTLVGEVAGRTVAILDDMIGTGGTLVRAAEACRAEGAEAVIACATHGLFMGGAEALFASPAIDRVVVTDTVPPFRVDRARVGEKLVVLDSAPLIAAAIRALHENGSVTALEGD